MGPEAPTRYTKLARCWRGSCYGIGIAVSAIFVLIMIWLVWCYVGLLSVPDAEGQRRGMASYVTPKANATNLAMNATTASPISAPVRGNSRGEMPVVSRENSASTRPGSTDAKGDFNSRDKTFKDQDTDPAKESPEFIKDGEREAGKGPTDDKRPMITSVDAISVRTISASVPEKQDTSANKDDIPNVGSPRREYDDERRKYDDERREYDDKRREYDDERRDTSRRRGDESFPRTDDRDRPRSPTARDDDRRTSRDDYDRGRPSRDYPDSRDRRVDDSARRVDDSARRVDDSARRVDDSARRVDDSSRRVDDDRGYERRSESSERDRPRYDDRDRDSDGYPRRRYVDDDRSEEDYRRRDRVLPPIKRKGDAEISERDRPISRVDDAYTDRDKRPVDDYDRRRAGDSSGRSDDRYNDRGDENYRKSSADRATDGYRTDRNDDSNQSRRRNDRTDSNYRNRDDERYEYESDSTSSRNENRRRGPESDNRSLIDESTENRRVRQPNRDSDIDKRPVRPRTDDFDVRRSDVPAYRPRDELDGDRIRNRDVDRRVPLSGVDDTPRARDRPLVESRYSDDRIDRPIRRDSDSDGYRRMEDDRVDDSRSLTSKGDSRRTSKDEAVHLSEDRDLSRSFRNPEDVTLDQRSYSTLEDSKNRPRSGQKPPSRYDDRDYETSEPRRRQETPERAYDQSDRSKDRLREEEYRRRDDRTDNQRYSRTESDRRRDPDSSIREIDTSRDRYDDRLPATDRREVRPRYDDYPDDDRPPRYNDRPAERDRYRSETESDSTRSRDGTYVREKRYQEDLKPCDNARDSSESHNCKDTRETRSSDNSQDKPSSTKEVMDIAYRPRDRPDRPSDATYPVYNPQGVNMTSPDIIKPSERKGTTITRKKK